jgi:hypothetical protein
MNQTDTTATQTAAVALSLIPGLGAAKFLKVLAILNIVALPILGIVWIAGNAQRGGGALFEAIIVVWTALVINLALLVHVRKTTLLAEILVHLRLQARPPAP